MKQVDSQVAASWHDIMSPLPLPAALDRTLDNTTTPSGPSGSGLVGCGNGVTPSDVDGPTDIAKEVHDGLVVGEEMKEAYPSIKSVSYCGKLERDDGDREACSDVSGNKCELVQSTHGAMERLMSLELGQSLGIAATRALAALGMFIAKLRTTKDNAMKVEE